MKKLLHLQALPLLTGVQNFSLHLIDGLPRGTYILAVASAGGGELVEACKMRGIRHIAIRMLRRDPGWRDILALFELILLIKRERYDIVHTNTSKAGFLGRLAARICKVPYVIHTSHGMPFQKGQSAFTYRFYRSLEKLGNRLCDRVVYVNDSDRINSIKDGLVDAGIALTVYNAIPELQRLQLAAIAETRAYEERESFVIGSTLRFSLQKNVISLTRAAIEACRQEPRLRFAFLGEGEELEICRKMVKSRGLEMRIELKGWASDIAKHLGTFDLFVLYSRWEAMPFSIIEAMHSGLAVIGSDIESIGELVSSETGWIVALDDEKALADCFVRAAQDPEAVRKKSHAARSFITSKTDYAAMLSAYMELYERGAR